MLKRLITLFFLFTASPLWAEPPKTLNLVANEWEPYTGTQILNKGVACDIVSTALRRAGYEVQIHIVPWSRAVKGVEAGNYDGVIAIWYTEERSQKMAYSKNYMTNQVVLFKRDDQDIRYKDVGDLAGYKIGTIRDYAYGEEFDTAEGLTKKPSLDLRTNVIRLAKGMVDLVPEDRFVMAHILNKNYPEYRNQIDALAKPLSERTLHLTISHKTAEYQKIIDDFNRELLDMQDEGLLKMMVNKHHLEF